MASLEWAAGNTNVTTGFGGTIASNDSLNFGVGSDNVTGGMDQSAYDLALLTASYRWTGNVGGAGSALNVDINQAGAGTLNWGAGGGSLYIGAASRTIAKFVHSGMGAVYLSGGTVTTVETQSGVVNANDATTTTTLYVYGGEVTYDDNATAITTAYVRGGVLNLKRGITTLNVMGGTVRKYTDANLTARAATTINLWGGVLDYRSGTLTTVNAYGGELWMLYAQRTFTVTNLYHTPGAKLYLASRGPKVTITNQYSIAGGAAELPRP